MHVPLCVFATLFLLFVPQSSADKGHGDKLQHYLGLVVKAHNLLGSSLNDVEEFLSAHEKYKSALGTLLGDMCDLKDHIQSVGNAEEDARKLSREKWQNMTLELGFKPRKPKTIIFHEPVDQFTDIQRLIRQYITGVDEDGDEWIEAAALSVMFFQHVQALTTEATKEVTR
ncbi:hypothetical protein AAVH_35472 [Aphelenchoides avenae]|nr:hypothetical protein AAVH_35472 [Aphelenchus avenae]